MRSEFERAGVWPLMLKRVAAAQYTRPGDPLRLDCGYKPNGTVKFFQAVSLQGDADAAKVLAFTLPLLAAGVERVHDARLQLTAVVEPYQQIAEAGEDSVATYRFGVEAMEQAGLRVLTANDLERTAQAARLDMHL
jgi:hypothetical protein